LTSLVIQTAFLGDVVLTTPLLAALARRTGPVDVVTTPPAEPLLATHPAVRAVIAYDKRGGERGLGNLVRLAGRLRRERYEAAYLPHRSLRSAVLARLARVPRRVGFSDGWPVFYTESHARPGAGPESQRLLALLGPEGGAESLLPRLYPSPADQDAADVFLRRAGITGPFVALAPGSIWGTKRWPYYRDLAARLSQDTAVVVVGGPEDSALGDAVAEAGGGSRERSACGKLTLPQSAALIGRAELIVTNDSAPLHLATAMGTPVVALFGPTVPAFGFGPLGARDIVLELQELACRPCSDHGPQTCPLGHHRCMQDLPVARVLTAIEDTGALRRRN
jgi:heptosyltransferase II